MFLLWTGDATRRGELHCNSLPLENQSILVTIDCEVFSNGPDKKESTKRNEHVKMQKRCVLYYSLHYTSDWLKQQIL